MHANGWSIVRRRMARAVDVTAPIHDDFDRGQFVCTQETQISNEQEYRKRFHGGIDHPTKGISTRMSLFCPRDSARLANGGLPYLPYSPAVFSVVKLDRVFPSSRSRTQILGTQVDSIFYSTSGGAQYHHDTNASERWNDSLDASEDSSENGTRLRHNMRFLRSKNDEGQGALFPERGSNRFRISSFAINKTSSSGRGQRRQS